MTVSTDARVTLLDGFGVRLDGQRARVATDDLSHGMQRLVARVCLSGRPSRSALAGQLWPDVPEDHAQGSLRSTLWRLHKAAPGLVCVAGDRLCLADDVRVDVRELTEWARRVRNPESCIEDIAVPDDGLLGDLLPGWYDDWVLLERERLRQVRTHALEQVGVRFAAAGRHVEALEAAYAAVRGEPLRESAHRTVVRVHLAEGNVADALRAYERFRVMLADELGVQPSEHMTRLVHHLHSPTKVGRGRPLAG